MMEKSINMPFNPNPPTILHIDLNSCFASIEQQADPFLRGKPIAVAAYDSPGGCIVAPSVEAKQYGVKPGMRVKEGRLLCPGLVVLQPDPNKYRAIHLQFKTLLGTYTDRITPRITPKSIDEFVLDLQGVPALRLGMVNVA
jgi:DNA polymerase IV